MKLSIALLVITLIASSESQAAIVLPFTGSTGGTAFDTNDMRGYRFEVFATTEVHALGVLDVDADGWTTGNSVFVGLWSEGVTAPILLASREVMPTS